MNETVSRDEILNANPLIAYLERQGVKLKGGGDKRLATQCAALTHKKDHWCVTVDSKLGLWHCCDCEQGGTVIDWMMISENRTAKEVLSELASKLISPKPLGPKPSSSEMVALPKIVATYDYVNEQGKLIYQVLRFEPKTFRQRQPMADGGWQWNMDGVTRILYRLPEVLMASMVVVTEGERDTDSIRALGWTATCNVGGAGKWLQAYSETIKGKDIVIIPDNDPPGEKHGADIVASLKEMAGSVKLVPMPSPYKDASDYIATFPDSEAAKKAISDLFEKTPHAIHPVPVFTMAELEARYRRSLTESSIRSFDLGKFLPTLGSVVRRLVPGELVMIVANTGMGKTALIQGIARAASPLPTLLFELELPGPLIFERFVQMEVGCYASDVENEYRNTTQPIWSIYQNLKHILVCDESGITPQQIESYIYRSELKIGQRPLLVLVDYIGLVQAQGKSRYEQVSYVAEQMKVIAKRTGTIVFFASQVSRKNKDKKDNESVGLHDARDSSSLECSAGLVISAEKPDSNHITLKILKNTKGMSGRVIECDFDGARMQIKEVSLSKNTDLPNKSHSSNVQKPERDQRDMNLPYVDP